MYLQGMDTTVHTYIQRIYMAPIKATVSMCLRSKRLRSKLWDHCEMVWLDWCHLWKKRL